MNIHFLIWNGLRRSLVAFALLGATLSSEAQALSIRWSKIAGGVVTPGAGGTYALRGTIGQPEAGGRLVGGNYSVHGGFWPGVYPVTPTTVPNVAPSFTRGADQSVMQGSGAKTVTGWATDITAGPASDTGQSLTFLVSNNRPGLFSVLPAISPAGTLTYTPAAGTNGTATVTVRLQDSGGTANGGVDTSAEQTFTITVHAADTGPANLASLVFSAGSLMPAFASGTTAYTINVPNTVSWITLIPTAAQASSTIKVNDATVVSGTATRAINLAVGANTITITSQDGATVKNYVLTVTRAGSPSSASLVWWEFDGSHLDRMLGRSWVGGSLAAAGSLPALVNDAPSGTAGDQSIELSASALANVPPGNPKIELEGKSHTVEAWVKFTRPASGKSILVAWGRPGGGGWSTWIDSTGNLGATSYGIVDLTTTANVPNDGKWHHVAIAHQLNEKVVFYVDGQLKQTREALRGVSPTSDGTLHLGYELVNGRAINPFIGRVDRLRISEGVLSLEQLDFSAHPVFSDNAELSGLTTSTGSFVPAFSSGTTVYAANVPNEVTSMSVTPTAAQTHATIKVNGVVVASGTTSDPMNLAVGTSSINVSVTAQDGTTTKTYVLTVTRAGSNPTGSQPSIAIRAVDGHVLIDFTGTIEAADRIEGPFTPVIGASSPFQVQLIIGGSKFFRAR